MHCNQYREAIQELADGTLGPIRRAELQTHLDLCPHCRALAADLQKIRTAAAALDPVRPPDHVWLRIAGQLRQEGRIVDPPRASPRHIATLAIAATLLLAIGGSLYFLRSFGPVDPSSQAPADMRAQGPSTPAGNPTPTNAVQSIADDLTTAERHYQSAIVKLEEATKSDDGSIDPQTAAILERNLQVIDQAIAESRTALQSEPQSAPARDSLFEALRKKVNLLQDTIALMNEMRKGNSAGAAQLVEGGSKS
ncbi:MAG: zf-HC2 domain-containing protein [Acidobacteria bacterium]|nr:zf-HC2 domain-containing protein [Acidobacteriota bacterium]